MVRHGEDVLRDAVLVAIGENGVDCRVRAGIRVDAASGELAPVTPENLQGGGSYRAAGFIYNVAPKDGTAIALIAPSASRLTHGTVAP